MAKGSHGRAKMVCKDASPRPGSRAECSLGVLTKHFLDFVSSAGTTQVDLNAVATKFNVQKRRIYDITNVLEGIGLIDKISKNTIRWKGSSGNGEDGALDDATVQRAATVEKDIETLTEQSSELDAKIAQVRDLIQTLTEEPSNQQQLYVTEADITSLQCFRQHTILAVKAPEGSTMEVTDPMETVEEKGAMTYRIVLKSIAGKVDVWLVNTAATDADNALIMNNADDMAPESTKHTRSQYEEHNQFDLLGGPLLDLAPAAKRPASSPQLPAYLSYGRDAPQMGSDQRRWDHYPAANSLASPMSPLEAAVMSPSPQHHSNALAYRRASHGSIPQQRYYARNEYSDGLLCDSNGLARLMYDTFPEGESEQHLQQLREFLEYPSTATLHDLDARSQ